VIHKPPQIYISNLSHTLQAFPKTKNPHSPHPHAILVTKAQGSPLSDPCHRSRLEALEQPWATVSDKSSAADIPRQWPATGLANTVCVEAS
jgi:hypothetical protein